MSFDIKSWKNQILDYLKEKVKDNQYSEIVDIVRGYKDLAFDIQEILEYASKVAKGEQWEKMQILYKEFSYDNAGEMVKRLNGLGYALRNDENYKSVCKAFSDQAYRIMEKTRYGQRSEVQYLITRIFVTNEKEFPLLLSKAFNPVWSDELFKTFIYSFLNGVLGETKKGGEES